MTDRRTVIEIIATTAIEVDIPIDDGDDPVAGVKTVLGQLGPVRHVVIEDVGDITSGNGHLRVEVYARVTLHFDPDTIDDADQMSRNRLATADSVAYLTTFVVESGPYRIEAW